MRYREVGNTLGEPVVILDRVGAADIHDGARVKFGPDRKLYVTMGDVANPSTAQDLGALTGKILRLNDDGTVPADNPFPGSPIYSYGHRNPQGIDWQPVTGELWATEHGQTGNDEINRAAARSQLRLAGDRSATRRAPAWRRRCSFFSPSIAPSGASFYTGTAIDRLPAATCSSARSPASTLLRVRFDPNDPTRDRRDGAAAGGPLRPHPRRRHRARRRALSLHQQPRRPRTRRSPPTIASSSCPATLICTCPTGHVRARSSIPTHRAANQPRARVAVQ